MLRDAARGLSVEPSLNESPSEKEGKCHACTQPSTGSWNPQ